MDSWPTCAAAAPNSPVGHRRSSSNPACAQELLRELAPLLAEEGIDVDNIDVPDVQTLNRVMERAHTCRCSLPSGAPAN